MENVNELLGKTKKGSELPNEMMENDIALTKPIDIMNKLNKSFVEKGPNLAAKIRNSRKKRERLSWV